MTAEKKTTASEEKNPTVAIVVALIGTIGVIAAAFFAANPILPRPTKTPALTASESATSTALVTPTSMPDYPCTFFQTCKPGEDWTEDCIASYIWTVYPPPNPPETALGCYSGPTLPGSISVTDQGLNIFAEPKNMTTAEEYGLFVLLTEKGTVQVTLDLDILDNGEIWFGVFSEADIESKGVLLVAPPNGDLKHEAFALKQISGTLSTDVEISKIYDNATGVYVIGFTLDNGSITAIAEGNPLTSLSFTSPQRWLFIGYRAKLEVPKGSAVIKATFSNLIITAR